MIQNKNITRIFAHVKRILITKEYENKFPSVFNLRINKDIVIIILHTEVVTGCALQKRYSSKFHKILRPTPVIVFFLIKFQTEACSFIENEALRQVFTCSFCKTFKNTIFSRTPKVDAFVSILYIHIYMYIYIYIYKYK